MSNLNKAITEERREIPVVQETDVLVIGGGVAGISAAVCAARNGVRVTLIEKSCVLGGLATLGHVCVYMPLDDGLGHKIYGGMAEELLHVCHRYSYDTVPECWKGGPAYVENPKGRYHTTFNIPACVMALDEFMRDEHVDVVFDSPFCAPVMDGNTCRGVIVENKSGRTAYLAKMIVDASGDADVMFRAGAPCVENKSVVTSWTYEIDLDYIRSRTDEDILHNLKMRWFGYLPNHEYKNAPNAMLYGTNSDDVNTYLKLSRSLMLDYLKEHQRDGYAMLTLPYMPQYRMTRQIKGLRDFDPTPRQHVDHSVGCVIDSLGKAEEVYEFPYEAIIDEKLANISAAGRIVAAPGRGWPIMRYIPACSFSGQVAGTASALAIRDGCTLQELNVKKLQENLAATGVMIHMSEELRTQTATKRPEGIDDKNDPMIYKDSVLTAH